MFVEKVDVFKTMIETFFKESDDSTKELLDSISKYIIENFSHDDVIEISREEFQNYAEGLIDSFEENKELIFKIFTIATLDMKMFNQKESK